MTSRRAKLLFLFALQIFDADRPLALEQDAGGLRVRLDAQVSPRAHERVDVTARRAPALALVLRHLVDAEAFLLGAVEVVANPELRLARALQKHLPDGVIRLQSGDVKRTALAVIFAVEFGIVLRAPEVGQHIRVGPAGVAERGPMVVVGAVAADIDHGIYRAGAAKPLAARLVADAVVEPLLRHGVESPVVELA